MLSEVRIAPSILSADFLNLGSELESIKTADYIHFDVMDGMFVPNLSFGPGILSQVKKATDLPVDVHLMIAEPDRRVQAYLDAGADIVTFHYEAQTHALRTIDLIKSSGAKAGIVINPGTPVCALESLIDDVDMVLVMSVNPGFGGQGFIRRTLDKLRSLRKMAAEHGADPMIEVDGGIGAANAEEVAYAGADVFVAGSSVFGAADRAAAIADIRKAAQAGLNRRM
jgi:ribulose-phosphate 3-epimerase